MGGSPETRPPRISTALTPPCFSDASPSPLRLHQHAGSLPSLHQLAGFPRFAEGKRLVTHVPTTLLSLSRAQRVSERARRQVHTPGNLRAMFVVPRMFFLHSSLACCLDTADFGRCTSSSPSPLRLRRALPNLAAEQPADVVARGHFE